MHPWVPTTVSGHVYVARGDNTTEGGNALDTGLVSNLQIACNAPAGFVQSTSSQANGHDEFTGMLACALCTITQKQPDGFFNAYVLTQ